MKIQNLTFIATIALIFALTSNSCQTDNSSDDTNNEEAEDFINIVSPEKQYTKIYPNSKVDINWLTNITGEITLEIFDDRGVIYSFDETIYAEDKTFNWEVPSEVIYSAEAKYKVSSIENPEITSESVYPFRLGSPVQNEWVRVAKLNGGESIPQNLQTEIKWSTNTISRVLVEVYYDNQMVGYFPSPQNYTDTMMYTNFSTMPTGDKYRLKISLENKPEIYDFSDGFFTITAANEEE